MLRSTFPKKPQHSNNNSDNSKGNKMRIDIAQVLKAINEVESQIIMAMAMIDTDPKSVLDFITLHNLKAIKFLVHMLDHTEEITEAINLTNDIGFEVTVGMIDAIVAVAESFDIKNVINSDAIKQAEYVTEAQVAQVLCYLMTSMADATVDLAILKTGLMMSLGVTSKVKMIAPKIVRLINLTKHLENATVEAFVNGSKEAEEIMNKA